ncbi:hypothetical protein I79_012985 [Cricetulus griseus]|uniref:Uncharacterized protein n=1 Tax=Cricetulus griseus TaxID=10029 RepID=G3HQ91_CRIGR|nr:hypothetical protein I79_012985 [Cricetulus griseus]
MSSCRKKSLAASLIAFSGVTRVRFTAAPGGERRREAAMAAAEVTVPGACH